MSSGIPLDSNFRNASCQLGGLCLNGNVVQGTASSLNVVTINDPTVAQTLSKTITGEFIQIKIGSELFFIPLYQ